MKKENRMAVAAAVLPFLTAVFFIQDGSYKLSAAGFAVLTLLIVAYDVFLFLRQAPFGNSLRRMPLWGNSRRKPSGDGFHVPFGREDLGHRKTVLACSIMSLFTMGLMQGICYQRLSGSIGEGAVAALGCLLAVLVTSGFWVLQKSEKGITENVISVVVFAAFLARIFYVVMTRSHLFQHDLEAFSAEGYGHLGYVYCLFTNGRLPDVNPMDYYEFCQPPLHYAVSAVYLKVFDFLKLLPADQSQWGEALQILPLAYSMMTVVFINKTGRQMKLSPAGRLAVVCFAGFLPFSIMMGGSLNNDPLAMLLMVMCIYFTFKWYDKPDLKGIVIMALCIGCAMMTKLSAALIAPPMAFMMLHRAWVDRRQWKVYLKQFIGFSLIAFPLGLWHSVSCYIKYRMPLGYAAFLGEDSAQYIGFHDKWARFFDFGRAFESLSVRMDAIGDFADFNIPVTLVKYATFDESNYYDASLLTDILGTGVFWANAALFLLMAVALVSWFCHRDGRGMQKAFMLTGAAVSLFSYLKFCIKYPHVCTMNIRYIMGAYYIGCLVIGAAVTAVQEKALPKPVRPGDAKGIRQTWPGKVMTVVSVLYAAAVIVLMAGMEALLF